MLVDTQMLVSSREKYNWRKQIVSVISEIKATRCHQKKSVAFRVCNKKNKTGLHPSIKLHAKHLFEAPVCWLKNTVHDGTRLVIRTTKISLTLLRIDEIWI